MTQQPYQQKGERVSAKEPPDFVALRTVELKPWLSFMYGNRFARIVALKGEPGEFEKKGRPFFGLDGDALESAFISLGWGKSNWCGIALELPGKRKLSAGELRVLLEIIDPLALVALDRCALSVIKEGYGNELLPLMPQPGKTAQILGRTLLCVDGFEAALVSSDNKKAKDQIWQELKALKR